MSERPRLFQSPLGATGAGWHSIQPYVLCPKEYQYGKVRNVREGFPFLSDALSIGILLHAGRAQWLYDDRRGEIWREAIIDTVDRSEAIGNKLHPAALPIAVQCMEAYVKYWSDRPTTKVLAVEHEIKPRALFPGAPEETWRGARYDSIEQEGGQVWIGELKSTIGDPRKVEDMYQLNGQTLLQPVLWGPQEERQFGQLAGVLLDIVIKPGQSKTGAKCMPRVRMPWSQLKFAQTWFRKQLAEDVTAAKSMEWNSDVRRSLCCVRAFGPCTYRPLCMQGKAGAGRFVLADGSPMSDWQPSEGKETPPWE